MCGEVGNEKHNPFDRRSNLKSWTRIRPKTQYVFQFLREAINTTKRLKDLRAMAS